MPAALLALDLSLSPQIPPPPQKKAITVAAKTKDKADKKEGGRKEIG